MNGGVCRTQSYYRPPHVICHARRRPPTGGRVTAAALKDVDRRRGEKRRRSIAIPMAKRDIDAVCASLIKEQNIAR